MICVRIIKKTLCILHNNIVDFQRLREYVYIILKWINTYFNTLIKIRFLGIWIFFKRKWSSHKIFECYILYLDVQFFFRIYFTPVYI